MPVFINGLSRLKKKSKNSKAHQDPTAKAETLDPIKTSLDLQNLNPFWRVHNTASLYGAS